jgi:signal transduction histidine kinase
MVLLELSIGDRVLIGSLAMILLFASFLVAFIGHQRKKMQYHRELQAMHEQRQKELVQHNLLLEQRVKERTSALQEQTEALKKAMSELEASQLQLVQKEKMASLGELTAGIAHEIQNPLNFVNNFAEINTELLVEIKEWISSLQLPVIQTDEATGLVKDISDNLHKILQHGKRADSIVKNMLQHSRKQMGEMELTDINELAEEYLKLSYHGYRAKNKTFNCSIVTSFDERVTAINIIPQEIGRILINLFNNAFYATAQKQDIGIQDYKPQVSLSTTRTAHSVKIVIKDNGLGIAQKFIDKIYQPFFTTKPTGEGTGLGLSMSYDIIKAHQGKLTVESVEGEFASFTIELPYPVD